MPNYPGDTMTMTGHVKEKSADRVTVEIVGGNDLGDHVTGTVELALPQ